MLVLETSIEPTISLERTRAFGPARSKMHFAMGGSQGVVTTSMGRSDHQT